MAANLPRLVDATDKVEVQNTAFTADVLGRFICNTWEEATQNGGLGFDAVVIGAGMFGAYCAEKIYRHANVRVLVLDAGCLLVTEHVQNLSRIGLNPAGAIKVESTSQDPGPRENVWGNPWRSQVSFPGLAYCLGGRSLYWGGWSPRLMEADLAQWPAELRTFLKDTYKSVEQETGVWDKTDYISGALFEALKAKFKAVAPSVPSVDKIQDAPLAVQAAPPASGLFSFDKWSSAPILVDAIREAASKPDWQRPLFYVPRAHVTKLHVNGGAVRTIELWLNGQQKFLNVSNRCAVVLANGTLEATRLAMESFPTALMGRNLMAHLRTNTAVLVRGSTPKGRYHLQVTAAAVRGGSEDTMWRAIPDIELLDKMLASQREDWIVVTLRGIGEMQGDRDPSKPKNTGAAPSWMDLSDQTENFPLFSNPPASQMRRAWINLVANADDQALWNTMDQAALALAKKLADDDPAKFKLVEQKRDGLGTTHHEAGTLWMGADAATSITDLEGRFHHVANAFVAGPAIFPTLGSANPSLTALVLARRTALAIVRDSLAAEPDFVPLGSGGLDGWQMAGNGGFVELGNNIIESENGIGLLWFTKEQFANFVLRADFRLSAGTDNSGIFIRIPQLGTNDPANDWRPAAADGYEIQIDNTGFNPDTNATGDLLHATGAIYTLAASSGPMPAVGQWHTFEIEAVGPKITVRLNGQEVSKLTNGARRADGFIGIQNHHGGSKVQFTRLRIKKLP